MDWESEARDGFWGILRSPWAILLAVMLVSGPIIVTFAWASASPSPPLDPAAAAAERLAGVGGFPSFFVTLTLVIMLAAGRFAPRALPLATMGGRALALVALMLVTWAVPTTFALTFSLGSAAMLPILLAVGVAALEIAAIVALLSLFAEMGPQRAALLGMSLVFLSAYLLPLVGYGLIGLVVQGGFSDFGLWNARFGFFTPTGAAEELRNAIFPQTAFGVDTTTRLDHPVLFSPWLWLGVLLAWIALPLAMLLRVTSGAPPEEEDPQPA
jgi:hypothetical protein